MSDKDAGLQSIITAFAAEHGAKDALKAVKKAKIKRGNAAVISKNEKGKLHIKEAHDWGMGKAAVVGGLAGMFIPGIGIPLAAAGGAVAAKFIDKGYPDAALKHLGHALQDDHSALVLLVDSFDAEAVERILLDKGGMVVSHAMDADTADALANAYKESGDESVEAAAVTEDDAA